MISRIPSATYRFNSSSHSNYSQHQHRVRVVPIAALHINLIPENSRKPEQPRQPIIHKPILKLFAKRTAATHVLLATIYMRCSLVRVPAN